MNRAAQALADALAGNVRLWISPEAYTQAHVRNLLVKAGVPVIWERGPIRVNYGRLAIIDNFNEHTVEVLWEPEARQPLSQKIKGLRVTSAWQDEIGELR